MAEIARDNPTAPQWTATQFVESMSAAALTGPLLRLALVAQSEREVCGLAVATALVSVFPVEAELESVAVDPAQQGRGVGRTLLQAVADWAVSQGAGTLRLEVRASSERALRMYGRAGFLQTGRRSRYYSGPVEDAVVMERVLQPSLIGSPGQPLA